MLLVPHKNLFYTTVHLKFATPFYKTQLVDIFAYEFPKYSQALQNTNSLNSSANVSVVYNFHNLLTQKRYFIFSVNSGQWVRNWFSAKFVDLGSISELFSTSVWLEREVAELHGVVFMGKKDLRNLMLQYGDTSAPFKKSNPSVGFREIFYDSTSDLIVQNYVTLQG